MNTWILGLVALRLLLGAPAAGAQDSYLTQSLENRNGGFHVAPNPGAAGVDENAGAFEVTYRSRPDVDEPNPYRADVPIPSPGHGNPAHPGSNGQSNVANGGGQDVTRGAGNGGSLFLPTPAGWFGAGGGHIGPASAPEAPGLVLLMAGIVPIGLGLAASRRKGRG
jgi:hypothetical protein